MLLDYVVLERLIFLKVLVDGLWTWFSVRLLMYVEQADMSSNAEHSHKKLDVTTCAYASSTVEGLGVDPGWSLG